MILALDPPVGGEFDYQVCFVLNCLLHSSVLSCSDVFAELCDLAGVQLVTQTSFFRIFLAAAVGIARLQK